MARNESDREDLIREATALRQRAEWDVPAEPGPVVTGFRRDGSLSVFFEQDPVYQFNPDGQLRRAYVDGLLYRTQGTTLAELRRERTATETTLIRRDMEPAELADFAAAMRTRLADLRQSLSSGTARLIREVIEELPPDYPAAIETAISAESWLAPAIATRRR